MTTKHTPTPWEAEKLTAGSGAGEYALTSLVDYRIGYVSNFNGHEQNAANAAFIVRAVNHHEALVNELKSARETLLDLAKDVGAAAWLTDPLHIVDGPIGRIDALLRSLDADAAQ